MLFCNAKHPFTTVQILNTTTEVAYYLHHMLVNDTWNRRDSIIEDRCTVIKLISASKSKLQLWPSMMQSKTHTKQCKTNLEFRSIYTLQYVPYAIAM